MHVRLKPTVHIVLEVKYILNWHYSCYKWVLKLKFSPAESLRIIRSKIRKQRNTPPHRSIHFSFLKKFSCKEMLVCETNRTLSFIIIWQGKSERCDWFFPGRDFTIRTVSTETVQVVYFFFKSQQIYLQRKQIKENMWHTLFVRIKDDDELAYSKTNERIR